MRSNVNGPIDATCQMIEFSVTTVARILMRRGREFAYLRIRLTRTPTEDINGSSELDEQCDEAAAISLLRCKVAKMCRFSITNVYIYIL
jgi:hypothetical protein